MVKDKVTNMEFDAFHGTSVIFSFSVIKVEEKKTNMLRRL